MTQPCQGFQPKLPLSMDKFNDEQLGEFLIERIIRGNCYGLVTNMSPDMLSELTLVNDVLIEKMPLGVIDPFTDRYTSTKEAIETACRDEWLEGACQIILSKEYCSTRRQGISEYLDRHLKNIDRPEDTEKLIEKLGLDINKKSHIVARHRVSSSIILGPPRNKETEFRILLSTMIHPEDGPLKNIQLYLPYSMRLDEFKKRLQFHTVQEHSKPGGWTDEDGSFIIRYYHLSTRQPLTTFQKLDMENYLQVKESFRKQEKRIAAFWHAKDYEAYERMKVRMAKQQTGRRRALEQQLADDWCDEGFSLEEGRLLDELMGNEKEELERQRMEGEAGSKT